MGKRQSCGDEQWGNFWDLHTIWLMFSRTSKTISKGMRHLPASLLKRMLRIGDGISATNCMALLLYASNSAAGSLRVRILMRMPFKSIRPPMNQLHLFDLWIGPSSERILCTSAFRSGWSAPSWKFWQYKNPKVSRNDWIRIIWIEKWFPNLKWPACLYAFSSSSTQTPLCKPYEATASQHLRHSYD